MSNLGKMRRLQGENEDLKKALEITLDTDAKLRLKVEEWKASYSILENRLRATEAAEDKAKKELRKELKYNGELSDYAARPRFVQLKFRGAKDGRRETFDVFAIQANEGHYFMLKSGYTEIEVDATEVK